MRVMVIVKATKNSESGMLPDQALLAAMGSYNEELVKAGLMLAGEGLLPSSKGTRVLFEGAEPVVVDGPFPLTHELVSGFWIWQVKTWEEAVAWLKRAPFRDGVVELRRIAEAEDFAASDPTGELMKKEEELRKQVESRKG